MLFYGLNIFLVNSAHLSGIFWYVEMFLRVFCLPKAAYDIVPGSSSCSCAFQLLLAGFCNFT